MMRAITYERASDARRDTISVALAARGWTLVAELVERSRSGATLNRPALTEVLERLDRGEADALVVAKLDHLSGSVLDFVQITERAKCHGWAVVVLDADIDTTSPTGELAADISNVAQWERRIIAARTSDALRALKARGVRLGRPVELNSDLRSRIAAEHAAGDSLRTIADRLTAEGVPTARGGRWHASTVRAVLGSLGLDAAAAAKEGRTSHDG